MRKLDLSILVLVAGLVAGAPAFAEIGALDDVPAATLLLPHFSVDLDNPGGLTTLISINNASEAPAIAHVTVWTDLSIPTLAFNVFLTGFDVYTLNLRDLFTGGMTPLTSHNQTSISPRGAFSITTNPVSGVGPGSVSCNGQLPLPPLPAQHIAHLRAAHTGQASPIFGGLCSGVEHGDNVARGYVTVDSANFCTLDQPTGVGYFIAGGLGAASNLNQLWGDFFYVDPDNNFAQGEMLVHLEASDALGAANYTFYRRYSGGADQREGLASTWASRFLNGGAFSGGTELIAWRDSKRTIFPFSCALVAPAPYPLGHSQVVSFDEEENPDIPIPPPFFPPLPPGNNNPFPWEANRTRVGGPDFPVAVPFGWIYMNLNTAVPGSQVPFEPLTQSYVMALHSASGRFSVGYGGLSFDNVTDPAAATNLILPECDGPPDPPGCF
jgi:hypothetical protein